MAAPIKHGGMSLQEIAYAEKMTVGAVNVLLTRALRKLRRQGLLITCKELAGDLDRRRGNVDWAEGE